MTVRSQTGAWNPCLPWQYGNGTGCW